MCSFEVKVDTFFSNFIKIISKEKTWKITETVIGLKKN